MNKGSASLGIRLVLAAACLVHAGCSPPHDRKVPSDLAGWRDDESFQRAISSLDADERESLARGLDRWAAQPARPTAATVREVLEDQAEWEASMAEAVAVGLAELADWVSTRSELYPVEVAAIGAPKLSRSNEAGRVFFAYSTGRPFRVLDLGTVRAAGIHGHLPVTLRVGNGSDVALAFVEGRLALVSSSDGLPIANFAISSAVEVPPGQARQWTGAIYYSEFDPFCAAVGSATLGGLRSDWAPEYIRLSDGTEDRP